jgi:uncharacterized protein (TIGR00255 family)
MVHSMTGFGRQEITAGDKLLMVDVKCVNGKQLEINLKIPALLKPYEFEIRNLLATYIIRGSVDCMITLKKTGDSKPVQINTDLLKSYYLQISQAANDLKIESKDVLPALLKLPEVLVPTADNLSDAEWGSIEAGLIDALKMLQNHRSKEGDALWGDVKQRIENIKSLSLPIGTLALERIDKLKENLREKLNQLDKNIAVDANRFEQEVIYYLEKYDITEEQIRLAQHCDYLYEIIQTDEIAKGKKIGFILQEIGREINTTGSKAYHAEIQKHVVGMKDELEKAKEQILNIL